MATIGLNRRPGVKAGLIAALASVLVPVLAMAGVEGRARVIDVDGFLPQAQVDVLADLIDKFWEKHKIDCLVVVSSSTDHDMAPDQAAQSYLDRWILRPDNLGVLLVYYDRDRLGAMIIASNIDSTRMVTSEELRIAMVSAFNSVGDDDVGTLMTRSLEKAEGLMAKRRTREVEFNAGWYMIAIGFVLIFIMGGRTLRRGRAAATKRSQKSSVRTLPFSDIRYSQPDDEFGGKIKWRWD